MPLSRRALLLSGLALAACSSQREADQNDLVYANSPFRAISDGDWKRRLPPDAYQVLRHQGTEPPGTSELLNEHRQGGFVCLGCELPLFQSDWKFESGTGWPSFYDAIPGALGFRSDFMLGYERTEYHCAQCLGHQGHRFGDGPRPTGLRYCNDGVALKFLPAQA